MEVCVLRGMFTRGVARFTLFILVLFSTVMMTPVAASAAYYNT
jgi:hypothetical protein